jgi:hypothetical protein
MGLALGILFVSLVFVVQWILLIDEMVNGRD